MQKALQASGGGGRQAHRDHGSADVHAEARGKKKRLVTTTLSRKGRAVLISVRCRRGCQQDCEVGPRSPWLEIQRYIVQKTDTRNFFELRIPG
jgi:hypothetical protein